MSKNVPLNLEEARFDVRLLDHRFRKGDVKAEEYQKLLASLPDDAAHGEESKVTFTSPYGDKHYKR